jgi:tRNA pseudouridine65 synthase
MPVMQKCTQYRAAQSIGGQHVYPIHRLDRKNIGVLLFALDKSILKGMNDRFAFTKSKKILIHLRGLTHTESTSWLWFN